MAGVALALAITMTAGTPSPSHAARGSELDPSWSPRGDRIAFTLALGAAYDRRRRTTVMTVRVDGTDP